MIKNYSTSQKTFKATLSGAKTDIWALDRIITYSNYLDISLVPDGNILDDYYDYFETLLEEVEIPERFFYSPTAFSEYYYGDPGLDFLVLFFANIPTLFEFNKSKIRVLPINMLKELNKLIIYKKNEVEKSKESPTRYLAFNDITNQVQPYEDYFKL